MVKSMINFDSEIEKCRCKLYSSFWKWFR